MVDLLSLSFCTGLLSAFLKIVTSSTSQSTPMRLHQPQLPAEDSACTETVSICRHMQTYVDIHTPLSVACRSHSFQLTSGTAQSCLVMVTSPWYQGDCGVRKQNYFLVHFQYVDPFILLVQSYHFFPHSPYHGQSNYTYNIFLKGPTISCLHNDHYHTDSIIATASHFIGGISD